MSTDDQKFYEKTFLEQGFTEKNNSLSEKH